jgi:hypothetical protein
MRRGRIGQSVAFGSFLLAVVISGCGGPSSVAEKSAATASVPEKIPPAAMTALSLASAQVTETAGRAKPAVQTANDSPTAKPVVEPATKLPAPPNPVVLAEARQLAKVLDLRRLPSPDGSIVGATSATKLHVAVPVSVVDAVDFYLRKLEQLGWRRTGPQTAESITESFAQVSIGKDGYLLALTAMPGKPKESSVTIEHLGNLDARTLPRINGAEDQYSTQSSSLYFARGKVDVAAAALRRLMKSEGWQEYGQAASQTANRNDASDILFRKKGYSVRIFINKPASQPDKIAVQSSVATLEHDLPAPDDAKNVQIQESRWRLTCEVPRDISGTAEYYRKTMQSIGFPSPPHETPTGKAMTLSFESDDHDLVLVSLKAADEHTTQVKLEGYSAGFREAMKKAEVVAKAKREAEAKAASQAKAERAKAFEEASRRQDAMIDSAIGNALKEATQPSKQTDLSKKIQADVKTQLDKALKDAATNDPGDPDK